MGLLGVAAWARRSRFFLAEAGENQKYRLYIFLSVEFKQAHSLASGREIREKRLETFLHNP
jgi:hypothetical protein